MKRQKLLLSLALSAALLMTPAVLSMAQDKKPGTPAMKGENGKQQEGEAKKEKPPKFKKYADIITEEAVTHKGVFTTHKVGDKLYFQIPANELGKEFLWVTQFLAVQNNDGYGGMPITDLVVRWDREGDRVILHMMDYSKRANPGTPEELGVKASNFPAVLAVFDIVTFTEDEAKEPVIDVTDLFLGDLPELSPKRQLNARSLDKKRSMIESSKSFPRNIETKVLATYVRPETPPGGGGAPAGRFRQVNNDPTATVLLNHSMVLLPDTLMRPRIMDPRVGFFADQFDDLSKGVDGIEPVVYISRWRLEKKDPNAAISEPVKPIVWYVGREVPAKWRKYVKEGIEWWQPAFEKAGFKNAIIAKDPPSVEEDPDWDAEDARYSSIRWLPSTIRNAFGPHIRDPRTGEILEADVRIYNDVVELGRDWYFAQCSAADPNAQKLPFSDELMGKLISYVVCHEVGHSLGLRHNHKSSSQYTVEQLRDPAFTAKNGFQASIMDYSRFNYVAQPGDGAKLGWDGVGIYDDFAIEWGYTQFAGTNSPEEDQPSLNKIAARQIDNPYLLFGSYEEGMVGSSDPFARSMDQTRQPVEAGTLGIANLQRTMGFLIGAATEKDKDYKLLAEMHGEVMNQWNYLLGHACELVGGIEYNKKVAGQSPEVFAPIDPKQQEAGVAFVIQNGLNIPAWMMPKEILERTGIETLTTKATMIQTRLLATLMQPARIKRMTDLEVYQENPYTVSHLVTQLADGIFPGLNAKPKYDLLNRNLQRTFVDMLVSDIKTDAKDVPGELRAAARGTLTRLQKDAEKAAAKATDGDTRLHLQDIAQVIKLALTAD